VTINEVDVHKIGGGVAKVDMGGHGGEGRGEKCQNSVDVFHG